MYWDGNMCVWGYILMGVGFVLFWAAVITAIILFARSMGAGNRRYEGGGPGSGGAENLLAERLPAAKSTRANIPPGSMCSARDTGRNPPPCPGGGLD